MDKKGTCWFENWFDTEYYHLLYGIRDEKEASMFIQNLLQFLTPHHESFFLDLACGKGRHSFYLHEKGYRVCGIDLSRRNIRYASKFAGKGMEFICHDMRKELPGKKFDYVFNLFTSFGYFDDPLDDLLVLEAINRALKPGGILVLDYFNFSKPHPKFYNPYSKKHGKIVFNIQKKIEQNRIIKKILVKDGGHHIQFEEKVRIYDLRQFEQILSSCGLYITCVFGDYELNTFNENSSDRLILIAQKNDV